MIVTLTTSLDSGPRFGAWDIYVVTALKPKSDEITKCEREIKNCRWIPLDEFIASSNALNSNRFFVQQVKDFKENEALIRLKDIIWIMSESHRCRF